MYVFNKDNMCIAYTCLPQDRDQGMYMYRQRSITSKQRGRS